MGRGFSRQKAGVSRIWSRRKQVALRQQGAKRLDVAGESTAARLQLRVTGDLPVAVGGRHHIREQSLNAKDARVKLVVPRIQRSRPALDPSDKVLPDD